MIDDIGDVDDPDPDPAHFLIRAAQGHSLAIEQETGLYTPLTPETAPPAVVHGTYRKAWPLILRSGGLKRMGRTHIHFAPAEPPPAAAYSNSSSSGSGSVEDPAPPLPPPPPPNQPDQPDQPSSSRSGKSTAPAEKAVVSGMRASAEISVYVDVRAAMRRAPAVRWWRAGNGVVLTAGDPATGVLASELFSLAVLKSDGRVLWQHGKPVNSL
jgi:2'-phosphotransferase